MSNQTPSAVTLDAYVCRGKWQRRKAIKNHKFPILGEVSHVDGSRWNIRDVRTTSHGFDLYYGSPVDDHGIYHGGLPQLIDTQALYDFWNANRLKSHGFLYSLPAGRTTLKRARKRLGFNFHDDTDQFWLDRIDDLGSLSPRRFAARHDVCPNVACDWRQRLLGRFARPLGWWRTPETIAILLAPLTLRAIGAKLSIKTSQVFRLRARARNLAA